MEPTLFQEELSERKVSVVGSELVENYTVSRLPVQFAPVSLACSCRWCSSRLCETTAVWNHLYVELITFRLSAILSIRLFRVITFCGHYLMATSVWLLSWLLAAETSELSSSPFNRFLCKPLDSWAYSSFLVFSRSYTSGCCHPQTYLNNVAHSLSLFNFFTDEQITLRIKYHKVVDGFKLNICFLSLF